MTNQLEQANVELLYSSSAIAHELQLPLTTLHGMPSGSLDRTSESGREPSRNLTVRPTELVVDQYNLKLELRDLAVEAGNVADVVAPAMVAAGIDLERSLSPAWANADRARIRQALLAVLDNTSRYAGRGVALIGTRVQDGHVVLSCADFGPGLPRDSEDKVFERFWQGEASRSQEFGGAGLGLSIVRAIARAHGGDAVAYSCPGLGTTIEIRLPAAVGPQTTKCSST